MHERVIIDHPVLSISSRSGGNYGIVYNVVFLLVENYWSLIGHYFCGVLTIVCMLIEQTHLTIQYFFSIIATWWCVVSLSNVSIASFSVKSKSNDPDCMLSLIDFHFQWQTISVLSQLLSRSHAHTTTRWTHKIDWCACARCKPIPNQNVKYK